MTRPLAHTPSLTGLYAITNASVSDDPARVAAALAGGARVIQYRDKRGHDPQRREQAAALVQVCHTHGALFLINDDVELALACGADGVHLGQQDMTPGEARARLGKEALIGITCHDSLALARQAEAAGASYVAFGRFFASRSKPEAPPAPVELLREARRQITVPIVAIGGISPENGAQLIAAGADMLAVIDGVFGPARVTHAEVTLAAQAYSELFITK